MGLPIPSFLTDKFCGFVELPTAIRGLSIVYAGFWVVYALLEILLGWTYLEILHTFLPEEIEYWVTISW